MVKRKRTSGQTKKTPTDDDFDPSASKLKFSSYADIGDSEDEFHTNRDKILLDQGPEAKRRKQQEEDIIEPSDEEVLAYSDGASDDAASEIDDEADAESAVEYGDGGSASSGGERAAEDEDEINDWGASKADYYNADVIETEQDALEEEAEARRLQQKRLKALKEADFGFDEKEWLSQAEVEEEAEDGLVTEILPQLQVTEDMGPAERLKLLKTRYPEFEPLAMQLKDLQPLHAKLLEAARVAQQERDSDTDAISLEVIKFRALSAYLGALAMYFVILTSSAKANQAQSLPLAPHILQSHGVMDSLVRSRENWEMVKDLTNEEPDMSLSEENDENLESEIGANINTMDWKALKLENSKIKNSSIQAPVSAAAAASLARRTARLRRTEESLAALSNMSTSAPTRPRRTTKTTSTLAAATQHSDIDSDIGDEPALEGHEAAEKARRKKSLRFYTSQIAQRANKRANAGRAAGGDDDVPYRERFRDRQERLVKEAENRGKKGRGRTDGTELHGGSDDEGGETNRQREERGGVDGEDDDYANALISRVHAKKAAKHAREEAYAEAKESGGRVVRVEERGIGIDGRRDVGYAIEKNKGLMPRRKKDVKNPRVKKRKKFEEKSKKLRSMKPMYGGGEGKGGYKGELTGIKKGLVRSVKF